MFRNAIIALALLLVPIRFSQGPPQSLPLATFVEQATHEEHNDSQILHTMHFISDLYGPRLTGSPNEVLAAQWAIRQMTSWGMQGGHLEPWRFGHSGWSNERASGYILSPVHSQLDIRVSAWTPSTHGAIPGNAFLISPPTNPTLAELTAFLETLRLKVRGKIVLVGGGTSIPIDLEPTPPRLDAETISELLRPQTSRRADTPSSANLTSSELNIQIDTFLKKAGALMRVDDSFRPYGEIGWRVNSTYDLGKALPTAILKNEDFSRIARILADGLAIEMEFNIVNRTYPAGHIADNAVAEIVGGDKRDSVVLLGAHLDSWHLATGATDNGIGCAIMMEAARILLKLRVRPRRTIRVVLFSGEEQGLLGSQAYVATHFGTAEASKPKFPSLDAYVNIDSGTGRIRAANVFGPQSAADMLSVMLQPMKPFGVEGIVAHNVRRLRNTDATTFSRAGLPSIGLTQDPINYSMTWHSNLDTYDQVLPSDAEQAAISVAVLAYQLAMSDADVPRFTSSEMPRSEGPAPK